VSEAPAIEYGRQFAGFYDRLFPPGEAAEQTAAALAELHPGDGSPSLELGVGTGRIALPLSERTGEVVGVDLSRDMLDVLRAALERAPRPMTPVRGDIRDYDDGRRYGLVYCVCATLSMVLDEAGQQRILDACARAAAPGAAVVIETHNPAYVEAMHEGRTRETFFVPYPGPDTGLLSHSTLARGTRLWQLSHVWFEDGRSRVASETSRLTTPEEVDAYAASAGLRAEGRYGDWRGSSLDDAAPTMVCVYRT
jgi:SAM-dependent methyltransferase